MVVFGLYSSLILCISILFAFRVHNAPLPYPYDSFSILPIPLEYRGIINNIRAPSTNAVEIYANELNIDIQYMNSGNVDKLFVGDIVGAETVGYASNEKGNKLTMLDRYGYVYTAKEFNSSSYILMNSSFYIGPGRSLGFHHLNYDTIVACNSLLGLIKIDISDLDKPVDMDDGLFGSVHVNVNNRISILSNSHVSNSPTPLYSHTVMSSGPLPLHYCNDVDVHSSEIYYSSSTLNEAIAFDSKQGYYDTLRGFLLVWTSGDVSGRLYRYDMVTHTQTLMMDGLYYANGVVVSQDGTYLLVVETVGLRVLKLHLEGNRKGEVEVFVDNLPGFPDGITKSADGLSYYISLVSPLTPFFYYGQSRAARYVIAWATAGPMAWLFGGLIKKFGCILHVVESEVSGLGLVDRIHYDKYGSVLSTISSVTPHPNGKDLFVGNLGGDFVSVYEPFP